MNFIQLIIKLMVKNHIILN